MTMTPDSPTPDESGLLFPGDSSNPMDRDPATPVLPGIRPDGTPLRAQGIVDWLTSFLPQVHHAAILRPDLARSRRPLTDSLHLLYIHALRDPDPGFLERWLQYARPHHQKSQVYNNNPQHWPVLKTVLVEGGPHLLRNLQEVRKATDPEDKRFYQVIADLAFCDNKDGTEPLLNAYRRGALPRGYPESEGGLVGLAFRRHSPRLAMAAIEDGHGIPTDNLTMEDLPLPRGKSNEPFEALLDAFLAAGVPWSKEGNQDVARKSFGSKALRSLLTSGDPDTLEEDVAFLESRGFSLHEPPNPEAGIHSLPHAVSHQANTRSFAFLVRRGVDLTFHEKSRNFPENGSLNALAPLLLFHGEPRSREAQIHMAETMMAAGVSLDEALVQISQARKSQFPDSHAFVADLLARREQARLEETLGQADAAHTQKTGRRL
jgi:hypothetical protein